MKKKIIGIIAGVVVIALLAGGYWLLTRPEETPEDETPAKADNLLVFSTDDVASFSVERKDGKGFDVTVTEREGERVYNVQDYDPIFLIRSAGFDAFLSSLSTIVPQETIEENAADLAKYGLSDPSVVARVTLKDACAGRPGAGGQHALCHGRGLGHRLRGRHLYGPGGGQNDLRLPHAGAFPH